MSRPDPVLAATRVFTVPTPRTPRRAGGTRGPRRTGARRKKKWPELVIVLDTETWTDTTQALRFGGFRIGEWTQTPDGAWRLALLREGLVYGDDLPERAPRDVAALRRFAERVTVDVEEGIGEPALALYSRRAFLDDVLWPLVRGKCALIVGFNLPFDLSRLAVAAGVARRGENPRRTDGGFAFTLWHREDDPPGQVTDTRFRPRLHIRHEDSTRAHIALGTCDEPKMWTGRGKTKRPYTGRFLDLRTLSFALTGQKFTLDRAARAFGVKAEKGEADYDGPVDPAYITYLRRDVEVTYQLLEALRIEFDRHPIGVDPWDVVSPASLAKGYLRACGITPLRTRARAVPEWVLGAAMEAFYGGRTECHIPRVIVPVVPTDFTAMYPTVQTLARFDDWLTAAALHAEEWTDEARRVLATVTVDRCLTPGAWPELRFLALVEPDADILPLRAQYQQHAESFAIGVNVVASSHAMWYTGFDLAASVLLTGKVPRIRRAIAVVASGQTETLQPVRLRGALDLDPRAGGLFRRIVELRRAVKRNAALGREDRTRQENVLKVLTNSGSYGIFAEMNPQEQRPGDSGTVRIIQGQESFVTESEKPEAPGEYCFPPLAALITGAARLMLALLERLVADLGGTFLYCDTDSLGIIASEMGGYWDCPGGSSVGPEGHAQIRVLTWKQVRDIVGKIEALNPYQSHPGETLLKIEAMNFRGRRNKQQYPIFGYGNSAKRYCVFRVRSNGFIRFTKVSEHGLGHLLNPLDPEDRQKGLSGAAKWIQEVWRGFIETARGGIPAPAPTWHARVAAARHGLTTPALWRPIARREQNTVYSDAHKPFNFCLTCYLVPGGHPAGTDPDTCHLIAPFEPNARKRDRLTWYDTASKAACGVTTRDTTSPNVARVKSVGQIIAEYAAHPESKSLGPDGKPAGPDTVGLLSRRHVEPVHFFLLGKEANHIEEVEQGQVRQWSEIQEIYENPRKMAWQTLYLPVLRRLPVAEISADTGISKSLLHRYRREIGRPGARQFKRLIVYLKAKLNGSIT